MVLFPTDAFLVVNEV